MGRARFDVNNIHTLTGVSSSDGSTPVELWADPSTHALVVGASVTLSKDNIPATSLTQAVAVQIVDGSGNQITSFGGGTQYTDAGVPPAHPIGPTLLFNNAGAWATVGSATPLPVTGSLTVGGTTDNSAFTAGTTTGTPTMGFYHSTIDTVTDGRAAAVGITNKRAMLVTLQTSAGADTGVSASPLQVSLANTAANGTAVKVDGSAVTQPVSGPLTDTQLRASAVPVSLTSTTITGTVTISGAVTNAGTFAVQDTVLDAALISQEATTSGVKGLTIFGAVTTNAPTYTTLKSDALSLDTAGLLRVSLKDTPANTNKLLVTADAITFASPQHIIADSGTISTITNVVHVDDNSGSLTVDNGGTFAVQATLSAETTKVIGVTRTADGAGNLVTSTGNALDINIKSGNLTTLPVTNAGTFAVQATVAAGATNIAKAEDVASADADVGVPAMAIRKASPANTSGTDGDYEMLQISAGRLWSSATIDSALPAGANVIGHVITDTGSTTAVTGTVTVSGTVTTTPPSNASTNIAQINGVTPLMGNGVTGTGSQRVTIASDNTAFAVNSTLSAETTKVIGTVNVAASQTIAVTNTGTFATQATLAAETTKVIGVTRTSDGAGNLLTSNSTTYTAKFGLDANLLGTLGTAFTTAGKVDVKGADGDVFVRQATAGNLNMTEASAASILTSVQLIDNTVTSQGTALGTTNTSLMGGSVTTNAPTFTTGQINQLSLTTAGGLRIDLKDTASNTNNLNVNIAASGATVPVSIAGTVVVDDLAAAATGAAVPSNAQYQGNIAKTSLPAAGSDGNLTGNMSDKFGRSVMLNNAIRDIMGTQTTTITASTSETTIITAAASIFHDLVSIFISNTSATATRVDIRDVTAGSVIFQLYIPAGDMRGLSLTTPWPQTSVNTAWSATSSTSVTDLRISCLYISNK